MPSRVAIPIALLVCLVFAIACDPRGRSAPRPTGPLRVQLSAEPASLDPTLAEDGVSLRVLANLHDGLVGYDGAGELENRLAESVRVSPDGRTYEFTIRAGAAWSDGVPVRAEDFVTAIRRALAADAASKLAGSLYPIRGARAGRPAVRSQDRSLFIELAEETPYFLHALTLPVAFPQRADVLKKSKGRWPETAPASGPYFMRRHAADRGLALERNPHYWRPRPGAPAAVEWVVVGDSTTAMNLFEHGQLDLVTTVPAEDLRRLAPASLHRAPFWATFYLAFNWRKPPFDDRRMRQAVAASVSRPEIVQALGGGERPARGWIPPGLEGALAPDEGWPAAWGESVRYAREHASRTRPLRTLFDSSARNALILEKVQADLKSRLGLRLVLNHQDWKTFLKTVQTDPPELFRLGIQAPFRDPIQLLQSFKAGDPNNYLKWSNPRFEALFAEISRRRPSPDRAAKIRAAQAILVDEEAIVVPIYHYVQNFAVSARLRDLRANPFGLIRFDELNEAGDPQRSP